MIGYSSSLPPLLYLCDMFLRLPFAAGARAPSHALTTAPWRMVEKSKAMCGGGGGGRGSDTADGSERGRIFSLSRMVGWALGWIL